MKKNSCNLSYRKNFFPEHYSPITSKPVLLNWNVYIIRGRNSHLKQKLWLISSYLKKVLVKYFENNLVTRSKKDNKNTDLYEKFNIIPINT